jgi:hypothetical protein
MEIHLFTTCNFGHFITCYIYLEETRALIYGEIAVWNNYLIDIATKYKASSCLWQGMGRADVMDLNKGDQLDNKLTFNAQDPIT